MLPGMLQRRERPRRRPARRENAVALPAGYRHAGAAANPTAQRVLPNRPSGKYVPRHDGICQGAPRDGNVPAACVSVRAAAARRCSGATATRATPVASV